MRTSITGCVVLALAMGVVSAGAAQSPRADGPVTRVDHFYAETAAMQELLQFFNGTLGLPEAWPAADYGSFASGAVSLGNVTLEIVRFADSSEDRATFAGIALEPSGDTDALVGWLTAAGMDYEPPRAFPPTGPPFFVNTSLPRLSSEATAVFVCDYKDRQMVLSRQAAAASELAEEGGGPLGVLGVRELVLESTDIDRSLEAWSELVGAAALNDGDVVVVFESGPRIRILPGPTDGLVGISISVESLAEAAAFLDEAGLAERGSTGDLRILPEAIAGLAADTRRALVSG